MSIKSSKHPPGAKAGSPPTVAPPDVGGDDPLAMWIELLGKSADRFWRTDAEHRVTVLTASEGRSETITDRVSYRNLIGRHLWDRPGITTKSGQLTELRRILENQESFTDFRFERVGADGNRYYLRSSGIPQYDEQSNFIGYLGVTIDDRPERWAKSESDDSRQHLADAMDNVSEGVAIWDSSERFVYCNDYFRAENAAFASALTVGTPYRTMLEQFAAAVDELKSDEAREAWVDERMRDFEIENYSRESYSDGRWAIIRKRRLDDGSIIVFYSNTTTEKAIKDALSWSGELFERIFDDAATGLSITDTSGKFVRVNDSFANFVGYDRSELSALTVADLTHPDDRNLTDKNRGMVLDQRRVGIEEKRYLSKSGETKWGLLTRTRVVDELTGSVFVVGQIQDITNRKQVELALQDSEETVTALLNASFDTAVLLEPDGTIVAANRSAAERLGTTPAAVVGTKLYDYFDPELAARRKGRHEKVCRTGEALRTLDFSNGRWIDANVQPVFGPDGSVAHLASFTRDVTEQHLAEETRQLLEERVRDFAESAADRFWETDADHRNTFVTPIDPNLGLAAEQDLIGRRTWDVLGDRVSQDDWDKLKDRLDSQSAFRGLIHSVRTPRGTRQHQIAGKPLFDEAGTFKGFRGTTTDVTDEVDARQAAETSHGRFINAIENAPLGVVYWDADDRLAVTNSQFREMSGDAADLLVVGTDFTTVILAMADLVEGLDTVEQRQQWIEDALESHRNSVARDEQTIAGRTRLVTRHRLADGGLISFHTDITELKEREEELRQAQKMEAIGHLTGGVAHDFNNLLAAIMSNLEILDSLTDDNAEIKTRISQSINVVNRGATLTNRLLGFARKQALQPKRTNLYILLYGMADLLQRSLGAEANIELVTEPGVDQVLIDQNQLENAIVNLVVNARDAMAADGVIRISCANVTINSELGEKYGCPTGRYVKLTVSDTGTGIPPENLAAVVEPFFTTKDVGEGSGLGLSMVYGFASQSGGYLNIESTVGVGTDVEILLPAAGLAERPNKSPNRETPPQLSPLPAGTRVVLVEDDPFVLDAAEALLKRAGLDVVATCDGTRIDIPSLAKLGPDVLVADMILPQGRRGLAIADELSDACPGLKVVLMSGYPRSDFDLGELEAKGYTFMPKPFQFDEMISTLRAFWAS